MKNSTFKKIMSMLLLVLVIGNLFGCASDNDKNNELTKENMEIKTKTAETQPQAVEAEKPVKIEGYFDTIMTYEDGLQLILDEYKKRTGIELVITKPEHNQYYEKVNLAFASGDIPDVLQISGPIMVKYASAGALYDITDLADKSEVMAKVGDSYKEAIKVNDRMYGVPLQQGGGAITYMRKDWLDNNNLKIPKTYDEFINVLKVFADDPDKNGKKDTIAMTAAGLISDDTTTPPDCYLRQFYQDAVPEFIKVDGKWVDGMLQPNMVDAIGRLKQAYSDGLFDKEIITNKTSTCRDKWGAGKVGAFTYWAGMWGVKLDNMLTAVDGAEMVAIPAIENSLYIERVPGTFAITSNAKNPEGIFKYFYGYMYDSGEGELLFSRGVQGVHYNMKSDGTAEALPSKQNPNQTIDKGFMDPTLSVSQFKDPIAIDERIPNTLKLLKKNSYMASQLPASENISKYSADLMQSKKEIISLAVLGEMTVEKALAKYAEDNKQAISSILEELNSKN